MLRAYGPAAGGACYNRRNDVMAASFRKRDNPCEAGHISVVKSLFNKLNSGVQQVKNESENLS